MSADTAVISPNYDIVKILSVLQGVYIKYLLRYSSNLSYIKLVPIRIRI